MSLSEAAHLGFGMYTVILVLIPWQSNSWSCYQVILFVLQECTELSNKHWNRLSVNYRQ